MSELSDIDERHIEVPRSARYATLGGHGSAVAEVWFVLHGYQQLAREFVRPFAAVASPGRLVVAPEGLSRDYVKAMGERKGDAARVGATWMTSEDRESEIRDYVRYLDLLQEQLLDELSAVPERIVTLGFSQGVHTASRWTALGASEPPTELVLWGSHLPPDLDVAEAAVRWRSVRITLVRGRGDPFHAREVVERDVARLEAHGMEARVVEHDGGHALSRGVLTELAGDS